MSASKPIPLDFVSPEWVASRIPRHAMGGKRARALNSIGLGCTAEPRRAR